MIQFADSLLDALAVHRIGARALEEGITASKTLYPLENDEIAPILQHYFIDPFKWDEVYQFTHRTDLALNEVYNYCQRIFSKPTDLLEHSKAIAQFLYDQSQHPKIKGGEFFVALWYNVIHEDEQLNCIGIFKAENRETFLRSTTKPDGLALTTLEGFHLKHLDKGALIVDTGKEEGYRVYIVDKNSRGTATNEAAYWRDDFLHLERVQDTDFQTATYLDLCRDFCENVVAKTENRKEQVNFLNRTIEHFAKNDHLDWNAFETEVMPPDAPYSDLFEDYKAGYEARHEVVPQVSFSVSANAVQKARRRFKNLIKLDTEVELKIKPLSDEADNPFVERGYDEERGQHFYKVYFNTES